MTEEEAREKWCPSARVLSDEGNMIIATVNRGGGLQASTSCVASDCMMWTWHPFSSNEGYCGFKGRT